MTKRTESTNRNMIASSRGVRPFCQRWMETVIHSAAVLLIAGMCTAGSLGCAVIAGDRDSLVQGPDGQQFRLSYVETLRNQSSVRNENWRELDPAKRAQPTVVSLDRPVSVAADAFRVYVAEAGAHPRIVVLDRGDRTATVLAVPVPPAEGKLLQPSGIAVDANGIIFVSDSQQGRVFSYDRSGSLFISLGRYGDLSYPAGIALDKQRNRLYIADSHAHLVRVVSTMGDRLLDIGGSAAESKDIRNPIGVALDRSGNCFILDSRSKRVLVYDPDGVSLYSFPLSSRGEPADQVKPKAIAVDSDGHIYIADAVNNTILIYDRDGNHLGKWGKTGSLRGDLWSPVGIFIDERDTLYIADQMNNRIQVYQYTK